MSQTLKSFAVLLKQLFGAFLERILEDKEAKSEWTTECENKKRGENISENRVIGIVQNYATNNLLILLTSKSGLLIKNIRYDGTRAHH